jgi:hypothetical protein
MIQLFLSLCILPRITDTPCLYQRKAKRFVAGRKNKHRVITKRLAFNLVLRTAVRTTRTVRYVRLSCSMNEFVERQK